MPRSFRHASPLQLGATGLKSRPPGVAGRPRPYASRIPRVPTHPARPAPPRAQCAGASGSPPSGERPAAEAGPGLRGGVSARSRRWWAESEGRQGGRGAGARPWRRRNLLRRRLRGVAHSLRSSSPGRARRRRQRRRGDGAMRRYLRVVVLCLACGFCSLLYAFSQLAVSLEEGAGGGGGKPQAAAASWLAGGGRGAGRGAGSAGPAAHPGRSDRYGPFPVGGRGGGRGGAGLRPARAACGSAPRLPPPGPRLPLLCRRL